MDRVIIEGEVSLVDQIDGEAQLNSFVDGEAECVIPVGGGGGAVIDPLSVTENGVYTASDVDGYSPVTVNVPVGLIIPEGFAYYNGYLLPQIPFDEEYMYAFIRKNDQTENYDLVLGTAPWHSRATASLDSWALEFTGQSEVGSHQYSIPQEGYTTTADSWGDYITSYNYYGTNNGRKVIFSSHDMTINTSSNILYKHGRGVYPQM